MKNIFNYSLLACALLVGLPNDARTIGDPVTKQTIRNWFNAEFNKIFQPGMHNQHKRNCLEAAKERYFSFQRFQSCGGNRKQAKECVDARTRAVALEFLAAEAKAHARTMLNRVAAREFINADSFVNKIGEVYTEYAVIQLSNNGRLTDVYADLERWIESQINSVFR